MHLWHAQVLAQRFADLSRRDDIWQVVLRVRWLVLLPHTIYWLCDALVRRIHRTAASPRRTGHLVCCCAPKCGSGTYFVWYLLTAAGCNYAYCVAGDPFSVSL